MLGLPCFFFEVVSSPQREENLLLRLLADLDMACVLLLTPDSPVRAATCQRHMASEERLQQPLHTPPTQPWGLGGKKANPMAAKGTHCWDSGGAARPVPSHCRLTHFSQHQIPNIEMGSTHHPHHFLAFILKQPNHHRTKPRHQGRVWVFYFSFPSKVSKLDM